MPTEPTRIDLPSEGGQTVAVFRWLPEGDPRGVVQLTHGMGEHVRRYGHLAELLTGVGFLVQGQDHRGHGATAQANGTGPGSLGPGGWPALVDDIGRLVELGRQDAPGVPLVLLGHSMGSFAAQQYLLDHSEDVDAAVLTGTTLLDQIEAGLDTSTEIDLSGFNAPFAPARTDFDWLSRDEAQVDAYVADPWCGFGLDPAAGTEMLAGGRRVADPQRLTAMRQDLPVYIAVGEQDPVGGPVVLAQMLAERYREAGLKDVTFRVWPGGRHEILNETNRDEVEGELLSWIDGAIGG
jgi:alpha-beta hydrolase superfamily lysophospholipase